MVVGRMSLQKPVSGVWSVLELQKSQQCALDEKVMYIIGLYNSVCNGKTVMGLKWVCNGLTGKWT